jgi:hypothetical protein
MKSTTHSKAGRRARRAWVAGLATVGCAAVAATSALAGSSTLQTALKPYLSKPTSIGSYSSLKKAPPKGKVVAYLGTSEVSNVIVGKAVAQVAALAHWKEYTISYDPANPATFISAMQQAVQKHANYVMEAGTPLPPQVVSMAQQNHIKIALDAVYPVPSPAGPVIDVADGYAQDYLMGKLTGEEFALATHGKGKAIEEAIPQYPILDAFKAGFQAAIKADCTHCSVVETDVSLTQFAAGQLQSIVVNSAKAHPGYNYIVFDDGPFADGISSALSAQGLSGIKLLGEAGDTTGFQGIQSGQSLAWTGYSVPFDSYEMMDAAFRNAEGMKVPKTDYTQPTQVVTKSNVAGVLPTLNNTQGGWVLPTNSVAQFKKVWKLG